METIHLQTAEEVADSLAGLADGKNVFRGQTKHYKDAAGNVSITTSMDRHGCLPQRTRQWTYYANVILHAFCGRPMWSDRDADLALLQHYGWRSFFIDASTSSAVAAWFASHSFSKDDRFEFVDLESGDSVLAYREHAHYSPADGDGYLYVMARDELSAAGVRISDLERCWPNDKWRTRMLEQRAAMLGPLSDGRLPALAVGLCIQAPAKAFREFAASEGFTTAAQLFPGRSVDPVLHCLLSVPWEQVQPQMYIRPLLLPEYEAPTRDDLTEDTFFSKANWIADDRPPPLADAMFFRAPELLSFATGPAEATNELERLVEKLGTVVIETEGLLLRPNLVGKAEFGKGVVLASTEPGTISVSELVVEYLGTRVAGVAVNLAYRYRAEGGAWVRTAAAEDCPCGDDARHDHLLAMASYLPSMVAEGNFRETGARDMTHSSIR